SEGCEGSPAGDGVENGLAFSPDGRRLAVVHDRKEVQVWDVAGQAKVATLPIPGRRGQLVSKNDPKYNLAFSRDGGTVMFAAQSETVYRWDLATGRELPAL